MIVWASHVKVEHRQGLILKIRIQTNSKNLLSDYSVLDPPDPMPNSEVKRNSVDDSVGFPCESRTSPGPNFKNKNTNKFKEFA